MLEVHPPHEKIHGLRDFFLHLLTITIGLLIALSLEGLVEWQHHRHLVHEAEASLHAEISSNASGLKGTISDIDTQQKNLKHDVEMLKYDIQNNKMPEHEQMEIGFHISGFNDVSWKTAQSTGALGYMPYEAAQDFSSIYSTQDSIMLLQQQAARDAILSLAPFMNSTDKDPNLTSTQANAIKDRIEILQGQLFLLKSFVDGLNEQYQRYLSAHPS